jgi:hypothetical protein
MQVQTKQEIQDILIEILSGARKLQMFTLRGEAISAGMADLRVETGGTV